MPTYSFYNKKTKKVEDVFLKISEYDSYLEDNPHMTREYNATNTIELTKDAGKLPEGFKDRLRLAKQKNPLSKGLDHLI